MVGTPAKFAFTLMTSILLVYALGLSMFSEVNRTTAYAESAVKTEERVISRQVVGKWVHAHEEDPLDGSGLEVYRPSDWPLGPSRGRRGFDLREDKRAILIDIAAADGTDVGDARWSIEAGNVLLIRSDGKVRRLQIKELDRDRLVVNELRSDQ